MTAVTQEPIWSAPADYLPRGGREVHGHLWLMSEWLVFQPGPQDAARGYQNVSVGLASVEFVGRGELDIGTAISTRLRTPLRIVAAGQEHLFGVDDLDSWISKVAAQVRAVKGEPEPSAVAGPAAPPPGAAAQHQAATPAPAAPAASDVAAPAVPPQAGLPQQPGTELSHATGWQSPAAPQVPSPSPGVVQPPAPQGPPTAHQPPTPPIPPSAPEPFAPQAPVPPSAEAPPYVPSGVPSPPQPSPGPVAPPPPPSPSGVGQPSVSPPAPPAPPSPGTPAPVGLEERAPAPEALAQAPAKAAESSAEGPREEGSQEPQPVPEKQPEPGALTTEGTQEAEVAHTAEPAEGPAEVPQQAAPEASRSEQKRQYVIGPPPPEPLIPEPPAIPDDLVGAVDRAQAAEPSEAAARAETAAPEAAPVAGEGVSPERAEEEQAVVSEAPEAEALSAEPIAETTAVERDVATEESPKEAVAESAAEAEPKAEVAPAEPGVGAGAAEARAEAERAAEAGAETAVETAAETPVAVEGARVEKATEAEQVPVEAAPAVIPDDEASAEAAEAGVAEEPGFRVLGVHHAFYEVLDAMAAASFYEEALGLSVSGTKGADVVWLEAGGTRFALRTVAGATKGGVIALEVDDVERARAYLREKGRFPEDIVTTPEGDKYFYVLDKDRNKVALWQRAPSERASDERPEAGGLDQGPGGTG